MNPWISVIACCAWTACGAAPAGEGGSGSSHSNAGAAASFGPVLCGATLCQAPAQVCCSGGAAPDGCGEPGSCPADQYACTGQENCPSGTVCCVSVGGLAEGQDLAQCQTSCGHGDGTNVGDSAQVCHPVDRCPADTTCESGVGDFTQPVCAPSD